MAVATDNRAIIEEGYDRFAQQDVPGVLALFSPEIVWTIPGPSTLAGEYQGPAGVGEFFGRSHRRGTGSKCGRPRCLLTGTG